MLTAGAAPLAALTIEPAVVTRWTHAAAAETSITNLPSDAERTMLSGFGEMVKQRGEMSGCWHVGAAGAGARAVAVVLAVLCAAVPFAATCEHRWR